MVALLSGCGAVPSTAETAYEPPAEPRPLSFPRAKVLAERVVFRGHRVDLYCGCSFYEDKVVDAGSCGYQPRGNRQGVIWWEHIVPASRLGSSRPCWIRGGRDECSSSDEVFKAMEGDLHNLWPAVDELNADRSDLPFGEVPGEPRAYGACDFEVDFELDVVEPREDIRGEVARAYLYMELTWGIDLDPTEWQLFRAWHQDDPSDAWERERDARIKQVQGNSNPWVHETLESQDE